MPSLTLFQPPPLELYHLTAHPLAYADGYTSNLLLAMLLAFDHRDGLVGLLASRISCASSCRSNSAIMSVSPPSNASSILPSLPIVNLKALNRAGLPVIFFTRLSRILIIISRYTLPVLICLRLFLDFSALRAAVIWLLSTSPLRSRVAVRSVSTPSPIFCVVAAMVSSASFTPLSLVRLERSAVYMARLFTILSTTSTISSCMRVRYAGLLLYFSGSWNMVMARRTLFCDTRPRRNRV